MSWVWFVVAVITTSAWFGARSRYRRLDAAFDVVMRDRDRYRQAARNAEKTLTQIAKFGGDKVMTTDELMGKFGVDNKSKLP